MENLRRLKVCCCQCIDSVAIIWLPQTNDDSDIVVQHQREIQEQIIHPATEVQCRTINFLATRKLPTAFDVSDIRVIQLTHAGLWRILIHITLVADGDSYDTCCF